MSGLKGVVLRGAMGVERLLRGRRLQVDSQAVKSVLVLEYILPLGCCVHMTSVFEAIKAERPEVVIAVATRGLGAAMLRHNPQVDHVIETPDALTDTVGAARVLRGELRRRELRPDCVLAGASDMRTRIGLLGVLSGAAWRGGFTLADGMYQRALEYDRARSLIDNNLRVAGLIGCGEGHREPKVYFSAADVAVAEGLVREVNAEGRPVVVMVTQNSGGQRTGWYDERWLEVIRFANEALECSVVYVGTGGGLGGGGAVERYGGWGGGIGGGEDFGDGVGGAAGDERCGGVIGYGDDACWTGGGGADGGDWAIVAAAD